MSTIATFQRPRRNHHEPDRAPDAGATRWRQIVLRIRVALHGAALTKELAAGAPPGLSPELQLRASQLLSHRRRRQMARTWARTIEEAHHPTITRAHVSIIHRAAVIHAADAIRALIQRLTSDEPVTVQGIAMLETLLTDGLSSPLYDPREPGTLRRRIVIAAEALDPQPSDHHPTA
jgi:hypothetical protein